jgi:transcriptional regulator with XRE-family HTH domain
MPSTNNTMKLGSRIKQLREMRGFSQKVIAGHLDMTQANYHKLESDKFDIRLEYLEKLANFYKISLAELIASEQSSVRVEHNGNNHNGVVVGNAEWAQALLDSKNEIIKLKDEKIAWLEQQLRIKNS